MLENEEDLGNDAVLGTNTPAIEKKYFKEVFDKYNKVLKCEAEIPSDDNMGGLVSEED